MRKRIELIVIIGVVCSGSLIVLIGGIADPTDYAKQLEVFKYLKAIIISLAAILALTYVILVFMFDSDTCDKIKNIDEAEMDFKEQAEKYKIATERFVQAQESKII